MAEQGCVVSSRDGWLNAKRAAGGAIVALPQYLSVEILSQQDARPTAAAPALAASP
jgi:hypothetical protein